MTLQDRFLNYISIFTTSDEESETCPSAKRELDLAKILEKEMKELGLEQVRLDENGYVYGLLPATAGMEKMRSMGFIAHMDTAPDYSGENVKPQIIKDYDGCDVKLAGSGAILKVADFPHLAGFKGRTLITTDGTTLLGADDKAGIAEILTMVAELKTEGTPHGDIWVGFTPDEEIGRGSDHFDLDYFKADYAYTLDGDYEGEIAYENFNACDANFEVFGANVHPGSAKNIMKNAASIACEINCMIPEHETPEHTEYREGFYHLYEMSGTVECAKLCYIVRDHDAKIFEDRHQFLRNIESFMNAKYGEGTVKLTFEESYHNMLEVVEKHMYCVDAARTAIEEVGLAPVSNPVRGGTDGANLSFKGLPCPNLGTGGYGFHGPFEHITIEGMENAVKIAKYIATHPLAK